MARKKTPAIRIDVKAQVSRRLRELRVELFGEHGGPEMARRLNLPSRTWYNYETGVTVPAEVLLGFIEETGASPLWLLTGEGPRLRDRLADRPLGEFTPQQLIRRSLHRLEQEQEQTGSGAEGRVREHVSLDIYPLDQVGRGAELGRPVGRVVADLDWIPHPEATLAVRLDDDAMAPILPAGSAVAIDRTPIDPRGLSGRIAAARVGGRVVVRWAEKSGQHLILRPHQAGEAFPMHPLALLTEAPDTILGPVVWSWSRFDPS